MNSDAVLAVLPPHKDKAMSFREIAEALGFDSSSSHTEKHRKKQRLARALRVLVKWGQVSRELKQQGIHLHNVYWKNLGDIHNISNDESLISLKST